MNSTARGNISLIDTRLILVSNREPYIHRESSGKVSCHQVPSGLVSALDPVMQSVGGVWVAWGSGNADLAVSDKRGRIKVPPENPCYTLRRVRLSRRDVALYYRGFSNRVLYPVCCHFMDKASFEADYWRGYKRVNRKFAESVLDEARPDDMIWVHDYHLSLVPHLIREEMHNARIGFFWHIPWPPPELFSTIPWCRQILEGLLGNDLIGFQTCSYAKNFMRCVEKELEASVDKKSKLVKQFGRKIVVKAFPIGIDCEEIAQPKDPRVIERKVRRISQRFEHMILSVNRLDYTKGILNGLKAFEMFLKKYPEFWERVVLVQVVSPSRTRVKEYRELKRKIDETVARINGKYQRMNWIPIRYLYRHIPKEKLIAYYQAADITLVPSLADGMNLVAKEYVAAKNNEEGALILSEFTGAAEEMVEAILINPYNIESVAEAIKETLKMPQEEKRRRLEVLRNKVRGRDIHWWLETFLKEWGSIYVEQKGGIRVGSNEPF